MRHSDALYAVVDQKLDRYRRQGQDLWSRLGSLLARLEDGTEEGVSARLAEGWREQEYRDLEDRFRGTQEDIAERVATYLPYLPAAGVVLDLGCGRGEALEVLSARGLQARGVDLSEEMVAECRERGLQAQCADLFAALMSCPEESLAGVLSLHVIEHLDAKDVDRLVRLAWRALETGGALILETPNPLSLVVAARNFWRDPTHRRPIHPETLAFVFEGAGFENIERLDLRPFEDRERLPDLDTSGFSADAQRLAAGLHELRDHLDTLLYGCQDYAIVGRKPAA
jgi:O-antigen chain-terminating methyltransferase